MNIKDCNLTFGAKVELNEHSSAAIVALAAAIKANAEAAAEVARTMSAAPNNCTGIRVEMPPAQGGRDG